jgi:CheY-like chemotaxis protein
VIFDADVFHNEILITFARLNEFSLLMIPNRTIILVEDSDSDRLLFSKFLKQIGYECVCMENAEILISSIDNIDPSIILMDIEMPGLTGLEAAGIIRNRAINGKKHVIIALTAHNDDSMLNQAVTAGFDDYLQKPVTKRELKSRLSRYLNGETETCLSASKTMSDSAPKNNKLYSLDMFDADDPDFVRSIVEMFVNNTPDSIALIRKAYSDGDMEAMRQHSHKLKPHFSFFGASALQQTLQSIEDIAKGLGDKEKLPELIDCADKNSSLMVEQMRVDLLS